MDYKVIRTHLIIKYHDDAKKIKINNSPNT